MTEQHEAGDSRGAAPMAPPEGDARSAPRAGAGPKPARRLAREVTAAPFHGSPLLWIWVRPRGVTRRLLNDGPRWWMYLFPLLATFDNFMGTAMERDLGDRHSLAQIVVLAACIAIPVALFAVFVGGLIFHAVGGWFGGRGSRSEVRAAYCWACMPVTQTLVFWIPTLVMFGPSIFTSEPQALVEADALLPFTYVLSITELVVAIWCLVIAVKALAEAHRFSAWRSLATLVIGGLLLVAAVLAPFALFALVGAFLR